MSLNEWSASRILHADMLHLFITVRSAVFGAAEAARLIEMTAANATRRFMGFNENYKARGAKLITTRLEYVHNSISIRLSNETHKLLKQVLAFRYRSFYNQ